MRERIRKITALLPGRWWAVAGLFGFLRAGSLFFHNHESAIAGSFAYVLLFLFRFVLYTLLFAGLMIAVSKLFLRFAPNLFSPAAVSGRRENILDYGILFVGWLPNILIRYPGAMCWDTWSMLYRYRQGILNAHHSAFYSLMLGSTVRFFSHFGHPDWGLWAMVLGQYLLAVFAFGYSLQLMRRMGFRRGLLLAVTLFYLTCPYMIAYLGVVMKDVPYSVLIFLLTLLLLDESLDPEAFCRNRGKLALLVLTVAGSCLIRKNGVFVVVPTVLWILLSSARRRTGKSGYKLFGALLCGCLLCFAVNAVLAACFQERPGSIREALSLPFQQTARFVREYGDEIPEEERAVIDGVLVYDTLAERYNPRISDPVKDRYTKRDDLLPAYFRVWLKQFFRHPLCYVAATWEQNHSLFVPEAARDNVALYRDDDLGYELGKPLRVSESTKYYEPLFDPPPALEKWKSWVLTEYQLLHDSVLVGTLSNLSLNTYLFLALLFGMLFWDTGKLLPFFPGFLSLLVVIAGPVVMGHPRYLFPVLYSMPSLTAFTVFVRYKALFRLDKEE